MCIPIRSAETMLTKVTHSQKCPYPLWADGSRWATGAAGSTVTHLHLRRVSSPQTASYTFSPFPFSFFVDYPNFESSWRSDVKQISGRVANPVASPQPVIGIHFEVIIGRATDSNPPVLFKFPRWAAYPSRHALTHTQRVQCHQIWPSLRSCGCRTHWQASAKLLLCRWRAAVLRSFDPHVDEAGSEP